MRAIWDMIRNYLTGIYIPQVRVIDVIEILIIAFLLYLFMVLTAASPAAADTSDASGTSSVAADSATVTTNAISGWPQAADVYSKCACLMDADTGTVLYNKGMDTQMFPASITKIMYGSRFRQATASPMLRGSMTVRK